MNPVTGAVNDVKSGDFEWNGDSLMSPTTGSGVVSSSTFTISQPYSYQPLPYQPIQYYPPYQWFWYTYPYPYPVTVQPKLSDEDLEKLADLIADRLKKQD